MINPINIIATEDPARYQYLHGLYLPPPSGVLMSDNTSYLLFVYADALELRTAVNGELVYRDTYNPSNTSTPYIDKLTNRLVYIKIHYNDDNNTYSAICVTSTLQIKEYNVQSSKILWLDTPVSIVSKQNKNNSITYSAYQNNSLLWERNDMGYFFFINKYIMMTAMDNSTSIIDPITGEDVIKLDGSWLLAGSSKDIAIIKPSSSDGNNKYQFKVITFDPLTISYSYDDIKMPYLYIDKDKINMIFMDSENNNSDVIVTINIIDKNGTKEMSNRILLPCDYESNIYNTIPILGVHNDIFYLWLNIKTKLLIYNYRNGVILYEKYCVSPSIKQLDSNYIMINTHSDTIILSDTYEEVTTFETPRIVAGKIFNEQVFVLASIYDKDSITNYIQKIKIYNKKYSIVEPYEYIINPGICDVRVAGTMTIIPTKYGLLSIPLSKQFRGIGVRLFKQGSAKPYYHLYKNTDFYINSYEILSDDKLAIVAQDNNQKYLFDIKSGRLTQETPK